MKRYFILSIIISGSLFQSALSVLADEQTNVSGSVEIGLRGVDDPDNSAKFLEYRNLDDGVFGKINLRYFKDSYYLDVEGLNIGQDDQSYLLEGGSYTKFNYKILYDEIPHNLSFDARSFYSGIGSNNLTGFTAGTTNESTWTNFDYSVNRKKYGGELDISLDSPFYINAQAFRMEQKGLKPLGSGSFSGAVELPSPVDYTTDDFTLSAGYRANDIHVKVSGMMSSFDNDNKSLSWANPFIGINEVNPLAPDNDYGKLAANLTWKQLPYMSTFVVKGSYAKLENDYTGADVNVSIPGIAQALFDGEVTYANILASLVSRPTDKLNSKLFYTYLKRDNNSSLREQLVNGTIRDADHDFFEYKKNNFGLDINYIFNQDTKVWAGYEYVKLERDNRPDAENTSDNIFYLKARNTSLDIVTAKLQYKYLDRDSDAEHDLTGINASDAEYIQQFIQRYDQTSKRKHELKLTLEVYPADNFDFAVEYTYANNDYQDVTLGRTEDKGHELYVDFMWYASRFLHLSGFAGYETYEADSNHYNHRAGFAGQLADPTVIDASPDSFRWTQNLDDNFWSYGLQAQMPLMKNRLKLSLAWEYQQSDGETNFSTEGTDPLSDIDKSEDYSISTLEAKGVYSLAEQFDLALGYIYERSNYEDLQYVGYEYTPSGTALSGAYADHDYEAHVGYLTVSYNF